MTELNDAFGMVQNWLESMEGDELAEEDFYSFTNGYDFKDVENLLHSIAYWYNKKILGAWQPTKSMV